MTQSCACATPSPHGGGGYHSGSVAGWPSLPCMVATLSTASSAAMSSGVGGRAYDTRRTYGCGMRLKHACDRQPFTGTMPKISYMYHISLGYDSYDKLIQDPEIDAVEEMINPFNDWAPCGSESAFAKGRARDLVRNAWNMAKLSGNRHTFGPGGH